MTTTDTPLLSAVLAALDVDSRVNVVVLRPHVDSAGEIADFRVVTANASIEATIGQPVIGRLAEEFLRPDRFQGELAANLEAWRAGPVQHLVAFRDNRRSAGGDDRLAQVTRVRVGDVLMVVWHDVTSDAAEQAARQRFQAVVELAADLILVVDRDRRITYASPSAERLVARSGRAWTDVRFGDLAAPEDRQVVLTLFDEACRAEPGVVVRARTRFLAAPDDSRWAEMQATNHLGTAGVAGVVINVRDVTSEHRTQEELERQALHDQLTGLPNRRWFTESLQHALARAARSGCPLGVLLVDIDHFKNVNDAYGHPVGDELLSALADRMAEAVRPGDSVARLGGDEFAVLVESLHRPEDVISVAERVVAHASGTYAVGGVQLPVTVSVGLTTAAPSAAGADSVLSAADAALYEAKRRGRNRVQVYEPQLHEALLERLALAEDLQRGLPAGELTLHWQPILTTGTDSVMGAEALIRWNHPTRGLLRPHLFLGVADDSGLMPAICRWVFSTVMTQASAWAREVPDPPRVFVNIDRHLLTSGTLAQALASAVTEHGVDPRAVTVELSERIAMSEIPAVSEQLQAVRALGSAVALDDFGAGNTSLTWLQELPVDMLKLDQRFTRDLAEPATLAIVQAILELAPRLGISVIAEGVETDAQLETLSRLHCPYTQGYLHCHPRPADEITALLTSR